MAGRRRGRAGFTLFELMLVLMILALAAAFVAPRATSLSTRRLDGTMRQAFAMARHARSLAVTRGCQARIVIEASQRRLYLETEKDPFDAPGVFEPTGDEWGAGIELPEGIDFAGVERDTILFRPDGTADEALITLREDKGSERALEVRGSTGLSRVLEEEETAYRNSRRREQGR